MSTTRRSNNVVIKTEPGTSGIVIKTEPGSSGVIIKSEPGASPGRLSSFKLPRDLTLGGQSTRKASSKKYTPNLSVVRNKKENVQVQTDKTKNRAHGKDRVEKSKNDNKKNYQRGMSNYIQTRGIFSDGITGGIKRVSSHGYNAKENDNGPNLIQKPRLNLKRELKVDKDDEKAQIQNLLQMYNDDSEYTDDPAVLENMPNTLPIMTKENMLNIKREEKPKIAHVNGVAIKAEPLDTDQKPSNATQNFTHLLGDVKIKSEVYPSETVGHLFTRADSTLFLLQLPDSLPGQGPQEETKEPVAASSCQMPITNLSDNMCTLKQLDEGQIGKVVLYKSGKAQLILGETKFDIDLGTQSTFLQEVMSVNVNKEQRNGDMINLGPIDAKIITTPDWTRML